MSLSTPKRYENQSVDPSSYHDDTEEAKAALERFLSDQQKPFSPRTLKHLQDTLQLGHTISKMSHDDPTLSQKREEFLENFNYINYLRDDDESTAGLRHHLQEISLDCILIGYGDYLMEACQIFRSIADSKGAKWGKRQITDIWSILEKEEKALEKWEQAGKKEDKPKRPMMLQLDSIAEQTNTNYGTVRNIIKAYSDRNLLVHIPDINQMIQREDWWGLATRIRNDIRVLDDITSTHPKFHELRATVLEAMDMFQLKFFKDVDSVEYEDRVIVAGFVLQLEWERPAVQEELRKEAETKEQLKRLRALQEQAVSQMEKAAKTNQLDERLSTQWEELMEAEMNQKFTAKALKVKKQDLEEKIKEKIKEHEREIDKYRQAIEKYETEMKKCDKELARIKEEKIDLALETVDLGNQISELG
jgi:hypothetical protein